MSKHTMEHNGETLVSPTGVIVMALHGWRVDHKQECREALERYCQYLAMHSYGKGATAIWKELALMDDQQAREWVESTFARYVSDPIAAVEYVLGEMAQRP